MQQRWKYKLQHWKMQSGLSGILSHSDNHPRVACDNQPHDNIA